MAIALHCYKLPYDKPLANRRLPIEDSRDLLTLKSGKSYRKSEKEGASYAFRPSREDFLAAITISSTSGPVMKPCLLICSATFSMASYRSAQMAFARSCAWA